MWYGNGQKEIEGNYKDGKLDGKYIQWYENGVIVAHGDYSSVVGNE